MQIQPIKYMRRPFVIIGYEVTIENMTTLTSWCRGQIFHENGVPFIRVPVDRPMNRRQTEAYVGLIITMSVQNDEESFKVCTKEWLDRNFDIMPREIDGELPNNVRHLPVQAVTPVFLQTN